MSRALRAEWTKLRTVQGPAWLLLAAVALTVMLSAAAAGSATCPAHVCVEDTTKLSLTGVDLGQALIAILAVLAISGEYGTGMIRTTLTAMPRRTSVLAAKGVLVAGLTTAAGSLAVGGSLIAGRLILPGRGFDPAHGYALVSITDGPTLRAAAGSVLYLALVALLSLGVATALRNSTAATGAVLGLLYLFPIFAHTVPNPDWQEDLQQISPMDAGLAIESTINLHALPIGPWAGLGVLTGWAAGALLLGGLLLQFRDA